MSTTNSNLHTNPDYRSAHLKRLMLTPELIEAGISTNGGWSRAQTECLGVPWPLLSGWKVALVGTWVTEAQYLRFLALRDVHLKRSSGADTKDTKTLH